ncbi:hypothetical protein Tco_0894860 [Tanacetum coccineum]|uniref:Uncharacterized protein n=1 Tax=Tanacetum coccineum TaxID=301880 RepID=A0ABQ5CE66_9ASTR
MTVNDLEKVLSDQCDSSGRCTAAELKGFRIIRQDKQRAPKTREKVRSGCLIMHQVIRGCVVDECELRDRVLGVTVASRTAVHGHKNSRGLGKIVSTVVLAHSTRVRFVFGQCCSAGGLGLWVSFVLFPSDNAERDGKNLSQLQSSSRGGETKGAQKERGEERRDNEERVQKEEEKKRREAEEPENRVKRKNRIRLREQKLALENNSCLSNLERQIWLTSENDESESPNARNRNNREVHLDYLRHLKESVETLREIVEEAKVERPLDRSYRIILVSRFENDHFGAIMGYGDYVIGDSVISRDFTMWKGLGTPPQSVC